jgi:PTS system fructose-specific IIC component
MANLLAVIAAPDRSTQSMLAGEALRQAATRLKHKIDVEIHTAQGVQQPLSASAIADADAVLLIGEAAAQDVRFANSHTLLSSLEACWPMPKASSRPA